MEGVKKDSTAGLEPGEASAAPWAPRGEKRPCARAPPAPRQPQTRKSPGTTVKHICPGQLGNCRSTQSGLIALKVTANISRPSLPRGGAWASALQFSPGPALPAEPSMEPGPGSERAALPLGAGPRKEVQVVCVRSILSASGTAATEDFLLTRTRPAVPKLSG